MSGFAKRAVDTLTLRRFSPRVKRSALRETVNHIERWMGLGLLLGIASVFMVGGPSTIQSPYEYALLFGVYPVLILLCMFCANLYFAHSNEKIENIQFVSSGAEEVELNAATLSALTCHLDTLKGSDEFRQNLIRAIRTGRFQSSAHLLDELTQTAAKLSDAVQQTGSQFYWGQLQACQELLLFMCLRHNRTGRINPLDDLDGPLRKSTLLKHAQALVERHSK